VIEIEQQQRVEEFIRNKNTYSPKTQQFHWFEKKELRWSRHRSILATMQFPLCEEVALRILTGRRESCGLPYLLILNTLETIHPAAV
jgi:hypothetical protein